MKATRNVLNPEYVDVIIKILAIECPTNISNWLNSTWRKWFIFESPHVKLVLDSKIVSTPMFQEIEAKINSFNTQRTFKEVLNEMFEFIEIEAQVEWVRKAYQGGRGELWFLQGLSMEDARTYIHWVDYLRTLPDKLISKSIPQLILEVEKWNEKLHQQEITTSLKEGVKVIDCPPLEGTNTILVKLMTIYSHIAEGQAMGNCIKDLHYFQMKGCYIYSLRDKDTYKPSLSIQVLVQENIPFVVHVEGKYAASINEEQYEILQKILPYLEGEAYLNSQLIDVDSAYADSHFDLM